MGQLLPLPPDASPWNTLSIGQQVSEQEVWRDLVGASIIQLPFRAIICRRKCASVCLYLRFGARLLVASLIHFEIQFELYPNHFCEAS